VFLRPFRSCDDFGVRTQSHDQAPKQDDASEEHAGREALEHDVRGRFSQTVRNEEDRERVVVIVRASHS